ncbi:MAG: molybdate ABC transporter permease subunit [Chthoniobacterales bacterium]|nr:MAG: molybdate ABC transporter permease subunit [Chthoniobacterales bacterium]
MHLPPDFGEALWLTLRLAFSTTLFLVLLGLPLAQWLNRSRWRGILLVETILTLPVVLPPTVIGFYLLVLFAPQRTLGGWWQALFGQSLAFSFAGLVLGSMIYSLPFALQPFQAALRTVPKALVDAARLDGASRLQAFRHVILPLAGRGLMVGIVLSFAHTVGEFGVVLMLGGSIPGKTKVASIALYDEVQKLEYSSAHAYALVLLAVSFVLLLFMSFLRRQIPENVVC